MYRYGAMQKAGGAGIGGGISTDTGFIDLVTFTDNAAVGTTVWVNPTFAATEDANTASAVSAATNAISHFLHAVDLTGTPIPTGASIDGVEVGIRSDTATGSSIVDRASLVTAAGIQVPSASASEELQGVTPAHITIGGPTNMWGIGLTAADVNDVGFGVAISIENLGGAFNTCVIYHVEMKVYYTT